MKLFLKILGGVLIFFVLLIVALNIYFTDERLKNMILPPVSEALDREVQAERISFTFFRTFPRFGVQIQEFELPGVEEEPVARFEQLTAAVRLTPLFRSEIAITQLDIDRPDLYYRVYEDTTSNIDFLLDMETEVDEDPDAAEFTLQIPALNIREANIYYSDATTGWRADMERLNATLGLQYAEQIHTTLDATLQSLSVWGEDEAVYLSGLSLSLQQSSVLDLEQEMLTISEGRFSIRGFTLDLEGSFSEWSSDAPMVDLQFRSSTDDFGELLGLAPPEFEEALQGVESGGSLDLEGLVHGRLEEDVIPRFELRAEITDGWLRNPDLDGPIEEINFALRADNEQVLLSRFSAIAAGNRIEGSFELDRPFDDDAPFSFALNGMVDLGTVSQFYPLDQHGVERLSGILATDASGEGTIDDLENVRFNASLSLQDGLFQYLDVPRPIEDIQADVDASQDEVVIHQASLRASANRLSLSGNVLEPLADLPTFDVRAELEFDLETIKEFYPIDEDTLVIRGMLHADATLRGQADQIERALAESHIQLRNGYIDHRLVNQPLEEITFTGQADSRRLDIQEARFRTGENSLSMHGSVTDYLEDEPQFDLTIDGQATLADITGYYSLEPWIDELAGGAVLNLNARGPAGDPTAIALNGALEVSDVSASGDSLFLPVTDLRGILSVTPTEMQLENFFMLYGSTDIGLEGQLQNYLGFLEEEHTSQSGMPSFSGSYHSDLLDMDEMFDWDEEADEEPLHIELPQMTANVTASIDRLIIFGVPITTIRGQGRMDPEHLVIDDATAEMFDGTADGHLTWAIPRPDYSNLHFTGRLHELQVDAFFREFPIFGQNSRFEEYVTGAFSADVDYYTELDEYIDPQIAETRAEGTFGMDRARLRGHPMQEQLARWLGASELTSLALDEWTARFTIDDSILTLEDFRLTSENIGIELDGTQHLETDEIDFTAQLFLPQRFSSGLSSVISSRAVNAMTRDDGIIVVPIRISGTMENPRFTPRESIIQDILRDAGRDVIRGLFN